MICNYRVLRNRYVVGMCPFFAISIRILKFRLRSGSYHMVAQYTRYTPRDDFSPVSGGSASPSVASVAFSDHGDSVASVAFSEHGGESENSGVESFVSGEE